MGHATPRRSSVLPEEPTTDIPPDDPTVPPPDAARGGGASDSDGSGSGDEAHGAHALSEDDLEDDSLEDDDLGRARRPVRRVRRVGPGEVVPTPKQAGQLVAQAGAVALLVALAGLAYGGGAGRSVSPGLPDPGALTGWGLPLTEVVAQFAAALVIGNLLAAVLWGPSPSGGAAVAGLHRRIAGVAAAVWSVAAVAIWLFTLSDIRGVPVSGILGAEALGNLGFRTAAGQAGLCTVVAALAATALCRRSPAGALLVALLGVLPPAFVESAVPTADHRTAIAASALETLAVTVWLGALAALLLRAARDRVPPAAPGRPVSGRPVSGQSGPHGPTVSGQTEAGPDAAGLGLAGGTGTAAGRSAVPEAVLVAARRFGPVALVSVVLGVASIGLSAMVVLGPSDTGLDSAYGYLVVLSLGAFGVAGAIARWRSTQTVPALGRGLPGPFVRFASLELTVLGALVGLSAAIARTPSPLESGEGIHHESPGVQMLGFDLPPSVSFAQLASDWRPDVLFLLVCAALAGGYAGLLVRARRAGVSRPAGRAVAWFAGVGVVVVATSSGVGRYAPVFFSVTIIQHVLLAVVAPFLLSRGAPITLALRALPRAARPTPGTPDVAGPREWLVGALRSRGVRVLTAPGTVVGLWVLGLAGIYFTGVFEATRWSYAIDLAVQAYLLGCGSLLFWWLTGPDPRPAGRRSDLTRAGLAAGAAVAAVVAGGMLATVVGVVAADWWIGLLRVLPLPWPWGSRTAAADQAVGGVLLAAAPALVLLAIAADRLSAASVTRRKARARSRAAGE
ncbi:cytochrome c oxidase assembly protein [Cryptosporangium arvum]|uniref:cytochrome c oxidase assembly protein n=1 Tax=Cryptosporangium arvum TaxID=80871 RepID=UPI0004BA2488|nr:cytochrome c oxidase assembly protein [Cryptosporangium arvum]